MSLAAHMANRRVFLLGATGYVGSVYREFLDQDSVDTFSPGRADLDFTIPGVLRQHLKSKQYDLLICAAGYTGKPNVDACEQHKYETLLGNAVLPGIVRDACEEVKLPFGYISSGCIYTGKPNNASGFAEEDPPNFSFRTNNCSFYSGSKALGEEVLNGAEQCYVWRLRIPFNHRDGPRNYLSKLIRYERLLDVENSLSHLDDFVRATIECWKNEVPFGTYNVTNPGSVTTRQVVEWIKEAGICSKEFSFFESEDEFMRLAADTPRSNCVLSADKILKAGIKLRPVDEAVLNALNNWITESQQK